MLTIDFKMVKGCGEEKEVEKEYTKTGRYDYSQAHHSGNKQTNSEIQQRSGRELSAPQMIQIQALGRTVWNSVVKLNQHPLISSSVNKSNTFCST